MPSEDFKKLKVRPVLKLTMENMYPDK